MAGPGDAVCFADDDRTPGRRRLVDGGQRADALADRARPLSVNAQEETRVVHEVDDGEAERIAEIDEARHLLAGVCVDGARVEVRIVRHDADGNAV